MLKFFWTNKVYLSLFVVILMGTGCGGGIGSLGSGVVSDLSTPTTIPFVPTPTTDMSLFTPTPGEILPSSQPTWINNTPTPNRFKVFYYYDNHLRQSETGVEIRIVPTGIAPVGIMETGIITDIADLPSDLYPCASTEDPLSVTTPSPSPTTIPPPPPPPPS